MANLAARLHSNKSNVRSSDILSPKMRFVSSEKQTNFSQAISPPDAVFKDYEDAASDYANDDGDFLHLPVQSSSV
jgi:hypothetical protein